MNAIVDWDRDAPQWPAVLFAARGQAASAALCASPLWAIYGPLIRQASDNRPFVLGQLGQSLDGRIATVSGESHYINGPAAIVHLHRLRALVDAVVVGVGTAIADDPQLTVRHVEGPQPARVVIDLAGRLAPTARCLRSDGVRRVVIQAHNHARPAGVECLHLAATEKGISPGDVVAGLHGLGLRRILVEGGANTLSRFLAAGSLHRLHLLMAPKIIGSGPPGIDFPGIVKLQAALRPRVRAYAFPDGETLFDCEFLSA